MKHFYILVVALLMSGLGFGQSEVRIRTEEGIDTEDIWVTITTGVNGTGSEVWTQKTATCAGLGLIDTTINIPAGTYYVNCHDQKGDGWTQTNIDVFAYNLVLGYASSPNDGMDTDATDSCDNTVNEIEASFEIIVPEPISCPIVLSLDTDDETEDKAILSWTNGGSETQWEFVVQAPNTGAPTTNGTVITSNPYIITGLSPFTSYEVYLRADCGGGDYSAWVGPESFTTTASPINSFPYNEDFESGNGGWSNTDSFASENWELGTPSGTIDATADGQNAWYIYSSSSSVDNAYVLSPPLNFSSLDAPIIEFPLWSACMFSVDGMALQSSVDDGATWQTVGGFNEPISGISNWYNDDTIDEQPGDQSLGWTGDFQDGWGGYVIAKNYLSGLAGESEVYLRFVFSGQGEMAFDAIQIYDAPCDPITGLTVDTISDTTATISWVAGGFESQWEVAIQNVGEGLPASGTSVNTNPYTATGLNPSTAYEVYVRADCGMDGTSDWVGPVSFTTNSIIIYSEQFIGQNDKGAVGPTPTVDLTGVDWNIDITSTNLTASTDWFRVENEIFEARDIDGVGIWLSPSIDISLYTDVSFSLDAGERGTMENSDIFETEYRLDGGPWTSASINGSLNGDFTNATVSQFMLNGNTLEIRVRMNNGADVEVHELDNILVEANSSVIAGPTIGFNNATSTENETDASFSTIIPVTMTNYDSPVTVSVTVNGAGTTEVGDYTLNTTSLTFAANETLNIALDLNDDADFDDEILILDIVITSGTADIGTNQHTVTIIDDETPPALTTIAIEDFDNSSPNWANDIADQTFVDPSSPNEGLFIEAASTDNANFSGNSVLGRDLNGEAFEPTLPSPYAFTFEPVNISAFSAVQLSFDYYAFANADYGAYEIILDGEGQGALNYFDDPDTLPGVNGTVTISIPNGTTTVALLLTGTLDSGSDVIELDNFKIEGVPFDGLTYQDDTWTPSAPDNTTGSSNAIILSGEYTLPSDVSLNDVYVNPGAAITVPSGTTLTVASLNLESVSDSYSSLLSNGTINGTVNYSRYVNVVGSGASDGNDLVSPPLTGQTWSDFLGTNTANLVNDGNAAPTTYGFGPFDKLAMPNAGFVNYTSDTNTALLSGVGYRSATDAGANLVFTGNVPASPVTAAIIQTGNGFELWNLIGNPFPSYITLEAFLAANDDQFEETSSGVYGYDGTNYEVYNQGFSDFNPGFLIAPGQGFFVASAALVGTVSFTDAMRSTGTTDDFIAGRSANTAAISNLKLQINTANNAFDTDFYFTPNATRGLDPGYDSSLFGNTAPTFSIYSHLVEDNNGSVLAVQSFTDSDLTDVVVPLGVNANQGEQLTFSIAASTLPNGTEVFLEDNVANTMTLLNSGDYTLTPNTALNGTGRFFLRFTNSVLSTPENTLDGLGIYTNQTNRTIVITGQLSTTTTASVYDLQGRRITTKVLDSASRNHAIDVNNLSSGIYVVTLENKGLKKSQKVILR